jgi:predicted lactoylglutathione lyase
MIEQHVRSLCLKETTRRSSTVLHPFLTLSASWKLAAVIARLASEFPGESRSIVEQRVSIVTLGVADLKRSREFYERLGWRRSMVRAEGVVFFQAVGMALALYPRTDLAKDANVAVDGQGFSGMALAYNARSREEVDSVLSEALAAGAKIPKPAQEAFWGGYSGYFADPDGFLWEVAWNPSFPVAVDGSIKIPD